MSYTNPFEKVTRGLSEQRFSDRQHLGEIKQRQSRRVNGFIDGAQFPRCPKGHGAVAFATCPRCGSTPE